MKKIIIIGAGGNSKVIIDILLERIKKFNENIKIIGILDDDESKKTFQGYPVLGPIERIHSMKSDGSSFFINGIGNNTVRKRIFDAYQDVQYFTAIHPTAIIGSNVSIGTGSIIMPGAIINVDSRIGTHVIINTGAIVEHDNVIGNFAHIASGVTTAGNVHIGECTLLGTGTKVIQGITIGEHAVIGAGAVVVTDLPGYCTAVGVPARVR